MIRLQLQGGHMHDHIAPYIRSSDWTVHRREKLKSDSLIIGQQMRRDRVFI
jgi:hypothetical protein